ncbi:MAG: shikimate dehydrogenase [Candidatus Omnitrophica bacterium]|nr:shikimate dehydrogenase [Candidatus Omnitrophota bacterium]
MIEHEKMLYGLIGYPVNHSLSPLMHNTAFNFLEVKAEYQLFSLKEEELEGFFKALKEEDSPVFGLNVTVPYKEKVLDYIDTMTPFAQKVQAVNTIVINNKREFIAYNTDGPGFLTHLTELGFNVLNKNIAIIGAGGASRAILTVLSLIKDRPKTIRLFDIDKGKVDYLISDLGSRFDVSIIQSVNSIDDLAIADSDLLINATPIGMKAGDPVLFEKELLHPDLFVYDLIYHPARTALLQMAEEVGAPTANGLGMLFYQGVLAFQHWADIQLDQEVKQLMWQALESGLKN